MAETTYRFESAKQGRAGCQNKACKDANVKIGKGELRFGVLVTFKEHTSWKWKHWGCVTPKQIENILEQLGGLDGLDVDKDLDILDGYDELPPEYQDKIKYALQNGHVNDEDWRGAPELNRPGMKGINKRTPKKKADGEETDDGAADQTPTKPKKGGRKKKADPGSEDQQPAPKKKTAKKRKAIDDDDDDDDDDEADAAPPKKKAVRAKSKKAIVKEEDTDDDEPAFEAPKKEARGRNIKPELQDDMADVPQGDGAAELDTGKAAKKARAKQRGHNSAVKAESGPGKDAVVKPAARSSHSKKVKTEVAEDDEEDILDDVDKKKQAKKGRGKKTPPAVVPEDEQTHDPQPEEPESAIKENADDDETKTVTKPAISGKKNSRPGRGSRTSRSTV